MIPNLTPFNQVAITIHTLAIFLIFWKLNQIDANEQGQIRALERLTELVTKLTEFSTKAKDDISELKVKLRVLGGLLMELGEGDSQFRKELKELQDKVKEMDKK
jgi:hypothetical protein